MTNAEGKRALLNFPKETREAIVFLLMRNNWFYIRNQKHMIIWAEGPWEDSTFLIKIETVW